jgi:hypothetical protein
MLVFGFGVACCFLFVGENENARASRGDRAGVRAFGVLYVSDSGDAALLDSGLSAPRHALSFKLAPRAMHAGLRVVSA